MQVFEEFAATLLVSFALAWVGYLIAKRFFGGRQCLVIGSDIDPKPSFRRGWQGDVIFLLMYLVSVIGYASLALIRHLEFHSGIDVALFYRVVWNSLHGHLLEVPFGANAEYLGDHFSPILLGIVPLYAIWDDASIILILQAVALTSAAFPIYWYARGQIGRPLALVVTFSYLFSPILLYVNLYDFHEIALATLLLALACFFLLRDRFVPFLVCAAVLFLVKEDMCLTLAIFGVFIFVVQRRYIWGLSLFFFGLFAFFLLTTQVIPYFRHGEQYFFVTRYASLGNSLSEILQTIFLRPIQVWNVVVTPAKLEFLLHFFVPLGLLPFLGIDVLFLTLPTFGYLLLSDFAPQTSIQFHYPATLIPFFYFASIVALRRGLRVAPGNHRTDWVYSSDELLARQVGFAVLILSASLLSYYFQSPGPLARRSQFASGIFNSRTLTGRSMIATIPRNSVVLTSLESLSQFSGNFVYEFPSIPDQRLVDYVFFEKDRNWYGYRKPTLDSWLANGFFEIQNETDEFLLLRRRPLAQSIQVQFDSKFTLLGLTIVPTNTMYGGDTFRPIVGWRANAPTNKKYEFRLQVMDEKGHLWAEEDTEPQDGISPTNEWVAGKTMYDQYSLHLPPTMPTGNYQLAVAVHEKDQDLYLKSSDSNGNERGTNPIITTIRIEKNKGSWTASQLANQQLMVTYFVDMHEMRFLGYYPMWEFASPGETLPIGLYWRAREKPEGDYRVIVQLRNSSNQVILGHGSRPANGAAPTLDWEAGEVLLDWHDLTIPENFQLGNYSVVVLLQDEQGRIIGETSIPSVVQIR